MSEFIKSLLGEKSALSFEAEVQLFHFCNLSCHFCAQNHKDPTGMNREAIVSKADLIKNKFDKSRMDSLIVNVMGGEIFNDLVPDEVFEGYVDFYNDLSAYAWDKDIYIRFNWVTNLAFDNTDRIDAFLKRVNENSFISTSYDFRGRFKSDSPFDKSFKRNLDKYSDRIGVVGFVLTKPSIKALLEDKDDFFKEVLYPNYPIYFDYYVPEQSVKLMMPSDEEQYKAFVYLAHHYPNVQPIKDLIEKEFNQLTCYSMAKTTILPDNREVTCRYKKYNKEQFESEINYQSNENIILAHIDRNQCFSCEFYKRCTMRCFVASDWVATKRMEGCFMKAFFLDTQHLR